MIADRNGTATRVGSRRRGLPCSKRAWSRARSKRSPRWPASPDRSSRTSTRSRNSDGTSEQLDRQKNLLTVIINALPDPIVITDTSNTIVVMNKRAEQLLGMRADDSEGRRRAVEINNLLYGSFLSKAIAPGSVVGGARELNLVDPTEGTDLLFEVLAHALPTEMARRGNYLSVLRDVTDLKQAAHRSSGQFHRERLASKATREARTGSDDSQNVPIPFSDRREVEHHPGESSGGRAVRAHRHDTPRTRS